MNGEVWHEALWNIFSTGYMICGIQYKMKEWVSSFKKLLRVSRWWQQSIEQAQGPAAQFTHPWSGPEYHHVKAIASLCEAVATAARKWTSSRPWKMMTAGTMIRMKKTAHRKMVRRKHRNGTRVRAAARGRLLSWIWEHPLQYNYTFWYFRRTPGRPTRSQDFEQNINQIDTFDTSCPRGLTATW